MKKISFSLLYCFGFLALNAQEFEQNETFKVSRLEIECSIICEDVELDYYEISWSVPLIDSIANSKGELPNMELHCFVYDSSGIIGFYKGLSTPMRYCSFQTKDSVVEVFFRWRRMPYSYYDQDSTEIRISRLNVNPFNKAPHRGHEFESVHLPVHATKDKKLTLLNDTNTVLLSYGTHPRLDPLGYPTISGYTISSVISLDRYYLNVKTGRIATGQHWVDRKGPREIGQHIDQYLLVSPSMQYRDENNHPYVGAELIKARKIKLKKFNLDDFVRTDKENYPY